MSEKTGKSKPFSELIAGRESRNPPAPKGYVKPAPTPAPPTTQKKD